MQRKIRPTNDCSILILFLTSASFSDLPLISGCVQKTFEGCGISVLGLLKLDLHWIGDMLLRVVIDYLRLDTCYIEVSLLKLVIIGLPRHHPR